MNTVRLHPQFAARCREAGCTENQVKAGIHLVERAMTSTESLDVRPIESTNRILHRIKAPKQGIRVIVRINADHVVVEGVLPRDAHTYETVETWQ